MIAIVVVNGDDGSSASGDGAGGGGLMVSYSHPFHYTILSCAFKIN